MGFGSFVSIEVCRDCIPALASSCKKQLTGFFVCLLFFLKENTTVKFEGRGQIEQKLTVTDRDKIVAGDPH